MRVHGSGQTLAVWLTGTLTVIVFALLYAPVFISMLFSLVEIRQGKILWETLSFSPYLTIWSNTSVTDALRNKLKQVGASRVLGHEVNAIEDIPTLVDADFGVGVWPANRGYDRDLLITYIDGYQMSRWVQVYTVFGRAHSAAARTLINLLRARDWSRLPQHDVAPTELVA